MTRTQKRCIQVASLWLLALSGSIFSQDMPSVTLIGSSVEENTLGESSEFLPHQMSVIELDHDLVHAMNLSDLLSQQARVQVRSMVGDGDFSSVSVRGSSASQVNVYLDGQLINTAGEMAVDLSKINLNHLKRIEIYRSGSPPGVTSHAIGGTIMLYSKELKNEPKINLELGVASFGTKHGSLDFQKKWHSWKHRLLLDLKKSDGDYEYIDDRVTLDNTADDIKRIRQNNHLHRWALQWRTQRTFSDDSRLGIILSHRDQQKGIPGRGNNLTHDTRLDEKSSKVIFNDTKPNLFQHDSTTEFKYHHQEKTDRYTDLRSELGLGKQDEKYQVHAHGLTIDHHHISALLSNSLL